MNVGCKGILCLAFGAMVTLSVPNPTFAKPTDLACRMRDGFVIDVSFDEILQKVWHSGIEVSGLINKSEIRYFVTISGSEYVIRIDRGSGEMSVLDRTRNNVLTPILCDIKQGGKF